MDQTDQLPIGSRTEINIREESLPKDPEHAFNTMLAPNNKRKSDNHLNFRDELSQMHEHGSYRNLPDAFVHVKKFANRHVRDSDGSEDNVAGPEIRQYNDNSEEDAIMSEAMENLLEETPNLYNKNHMTSKVENFHEI